MAIELDELQINIVANADEATSSIVAVADALKKAGNSSKAIKKLSEALREVSTESKDAADNAESLGSAAAESTTTANSGFKIMVESLKAAGNGVKALGNGLKGVVLGGVSKITGLISSIKRVAFYRVIRSAIKLITSALTEGVKTLIAWDREWGNNSSLAAQTADTINAKWAEVKKSLGAAAMPLIQILQPALMSVMDTVIMVANTINMVLRSIQGYGTYMRATMKVVGDGIKSATGRAKELKRILFGFDDLNVLPSDTSSGSGALATSTSPIDFVETDIDEAAVSKFNDILKIVKEIGAGLLAWKIGNTFFNGIGLADNKVKGLSLALAGAVTTGFALADQLSNGVTWGNAATLLAGVTGVVIGLKTAFGNTGAAIGLVLGGAVGLIAPLKELINTGKLTTASFVQLEASIASIGVGLSLMTGSWIPAVIGLGITGIIAGIRYEITKLKESQDALEIKKYGDTIANITGKIDDQTQSFRERREEILKTQTPQRDELELANKLMGKYQELKNQSNLTAQQKERLAAISKELVGIYPDLNEYINKENGLLDISAEQWAAIYQAKLKDIQLEARRKKLIDLYKEQVDQEIAIKEATNEVRKAEQVLNDERNKKKNLPAYIEKMQELLGKVNLSMNGVDALTESEKALFYELTNGTMSTEDARKAIIALYKEYANSDEAIKEAEKNYAKVSDSLNTLEEDYKQTGITIEEVSAGMYDDVDTSTTEIVKDVEESGSKVVKTAEQVQKMLDKKPWLIKLLTDTTGLSRSVANIYANLQNSLLKTPLVMSVTSHTGSISSGLVNSRYATIASTAYASGGTPDVGTLFWAGEQGAEAVMTAPSGRTGVTNVDQMQDAISAGNENVVMALYEILRTVQNKDTNVYLDGNKIGQSVSRYQQNQARRGVAYSG